MELVGDQSEMSQVSALSNDDGPAGSELQSKAQPMNIDPPSTISSERPVQNGIEDLQPGSRDTDPSISSHDSEIATDLEKVKENGFHGVPANEPSLEPPPSDVR